MDLIKKNDKKTLDLNTPKLFPNKAKLAQSITQVWRAHFFAKIGNSREIPWRSGGRRPRSLDEDWQRGGGPRGPGAQRLEGAGRPRGAAPPPSEIGLN